MKLSLILLQFLICSVQSFVIPLTAVNEANTSIWPTRTETSTLSIITPQTTLVWVTGIDTNDGNLKTTQSPYYQEFSARHTTVTAKVPEGTIGLGTIKGTIGTIRDYHVSVTRYT
ncbi:hypothetical protein WICMUC_001297 [Wickerhamomyces mucosus]|uniref:Secreted protein n=1 Tax=Wickerhamomyces mucosus TaxID=1378264 RepID=A0A9P8PV89_9ASCO|nr:hypothetical protein WICMUC_001297 [Wickerhamomyces mucosus]